MTHAPKSASFEAPETVFEEVDNLTIFIFLLNILFMQWIIFKYQHEPVTLQSVLLYITLPFSVFCLVLQYPALPFYLEKMLVDILWFPHLYYLTPPTMHPIFYIMLSFASCLFTRQFFFTQKQINQYHYYPDLETVGVRLQEILERNVIIPVCYSLQEDDIKWENEANRNGVQFITSYNTIRYVDRFSLFSKSGYFPRVELSIFDRDLPRQMVWCREIMEDWEVRQGIEEFLRHPNFSRILSRDYVFDRMNMFVHRGFQNIYCPNKMDPQSKITDAHIVENLMLKFLADCEFGSKYFFCESKLNSSVELFYEYYFGSKPSVYINRTLHGEHGQFVEYEVVSYDGVTKMKSIFDAFALFFILREREGNLVEFSKEIYDCIKNTVRYQMMY